MSTAPVSRTRKSRLRIREGDVFAVPLKDMGFSFGRICAGGDHAYYDLLRAEYPSLSAIVSAPVAFRVYAANHAIRDGEWPRLGNLPLAGPLAQPVAYWHLPVGHPTGFRHYAGHSTPAPQSELEKLELLAVWFQPNIEERLRAHFSGGQSSNVEMMLKRTIPPAQWKH